jgi:hypothetical protein
MKAKVYDSISKDLLGKEITILGLAADAKAGACLKLKNDTIVYIQGVYSWNSEFRGKKVYATGTLLKKKIIPDPEIDESGAISQGAYGEQLILENASEIRKKI